MIEIKARGHEIAEVLIHEQIGADWLGDGLTSKRFAEDLRAFEGVRKIVVRINSPGGSVMDGLGIYNTLARHPARKEVVIEGLAASMASAIAMVGDHITMGEGALMMIHSPWTMAAGNAEQIRKAADVLDKFENSMIDIYRKRSGKDREELRAILNAETWYDGVAAVDNGFAHESVQADAEIAALLHVDFHKRVSAFTQAFRREADFTPSRIAAVFKSATTDNPSEIIQMTEKVPASVTETDIKAAATEAARAAVAAETERRQKIRARFGKFAEAHKDLLDACLDDASCTVDTASEKLLDVVGKRAEPLAGAVEITADSRDKFMAGAEKAMLARMGHEKRESGNEFNGMSIADIAAAAFAQRGISVRGLSRNQIASKVFAAQTTSDFPNLLSSVAGKVLRAAYGNFPNTWNKWAAAGSVSDFKIHPRLQLGSFNGLDTIAEGGEYTYGSLKEDYENAQAVTKGKAIALTRQMIVNDDLGAFNRRAALMGRAAARSVNVDAYTFLTSGSSSHGPTSTDTGQYFNATAVTTAGGHANLTSSGTAISVASLGVGRAAMRKQKDKGVRETLNIEPAILLTSVAKEDLARQIITSEADPASSNSGVSNIYRNRFEVVSDPVIDGVNSGLSWYLFANPADVAGFEVVFLDGIQEPFVDETVDFDTDAMKFKVRLDYGIAIGDWRAGYKNVGA